jgi:hypothetical protein
MVRVVKPRIKRKKSGFPTTGALHHRQIRKAKRVLGAKVIGEGKRAVAAQQVVVTTQPFSKPTIGLLGTYSKKSIKKGTPGIQLITTARGKRKAAITLSFQIPSIVKMIERERRQERARLRQKGRTTLTREERLRRSELRRLEREKLGRVPRREKAVSIPKKVPIGTFDTPFPTPYKTALKEERDVKVRSSMVSSFAYNEDLQIMTVSWNGGGLGFYEEVPKSVFEKVYKGETAGGKGCRTTGSNQWGSWYVTKDPSVGRAMHDYVFGKFNYVKIL